MSRGIELDGKLFAEATKNYVRLIVQNELLKILKVNPSIRKTLDRGSTKIHRSSIKQQADKVAKSK